VQRGGYGVRGTANAAIKASASPAVLELTQIETTLTATGTQLPQPGVKAALAGNATIELGGHAYGIAPSITHRTIRLTIPDDGPVTLRVVSGAVNLDRMERVSS